MVRTTLVINGEAIDTFPTRQKAAEHHEELMKDGETSFANDDFRYDREWYITENYGEEHYYWSTPGYDVDVFIEPPTDRHDYYTVGLFDRTMFAVSVPSARGEYQTLPKALCHAFSLVANLDEFIEEFRATDDYQRAITVEEYAPPFGYKGKSGGMSTGFVPSYKVSNAKRDVYSGDKTVGEAVDELYGDYADRGARA